MIQAHTTDVAPALEPDPHPVAARATGLSVWWLHPAALFVAVAAGTLIPALALSESVYASYGTAKYLDAESLGLALLACTMVVVGVFWGASTGVMPRRMSASTRRSLIPWFYLATGLTLFGYIAWTASGIWRGFSPEHIVQLITGSDQEDFLELKFEIFKTVPGITTCTQFGLLTVLLGSILRHRDIPYLRSILGAILVLSVLRVFVISERLAFVEVVVLMGLIWLRTGILGRRRTPAAQLSLALAPIAGIVMLVVLMGGTEYFRSWKYYRNEFDSLIDFTVTRLAGYYSTSHNNGAMAWSLRDSVPLPYFSLEWFWHFPLIANTPFSYENLMGSDPDKLHMALLEHWGNPEFNNPGGLFLPTLDFGLLGGAGFWLAFGLVAGRLYRGFLAGSLAGLLLYPFVVLTILEMPRFLYIFTVRPFPTFVLMFFLVQHVSIRKGIANVH